MRDYSYTQNRELSWLRFNERVLDEAMDSSVPLFERLKFLSIFTSNLDEFYMIRVGSLTELASLKEPHKDTKSGMSDTEQLQAIYKETARLMAKKDIVYNGVITELEKEGICFVTYNELSKEQKKTMSAYFEDEILPVLSAQIVDIHHPFPHLINKRLYIAVNLELKGHKSLGIIPCLTTLRYKMIDDTKVILIEELIYGLAQRVFPMYEVKEKAIISVTRNGDIDVSDDVFDIVEDYRDYMQSIIKKRRKLAPVRLESKGNLPSSIKDMLMKKLNLTKVQVFQVNSPLEMSYVYSYAKKIEKLYPHLFYTPYTPSIPNTVNIKENMIDQIEKHDILIHYPYESMQPFLKLLKDSATDKRVLSIKITLYRLSNPSKIIESLLLAAENGKDVTVVIELKARFDEQNNIDWAEVLEEGGCNVCYGFDEYKVHSKICLISYKSNHEMHHIVQIGTGNYNEKTSKMYTDLCLITSNSSITKDACNFFLNMTQSNLHGDYQALLVAPNSLKNRILDFIDKEIAKGENGYIFMKMNSLSDINVIDKLVEASSAGVQIKLVIRGICCLLPNISSKTDNIQVHSIVGRYLEHSRIYIFGKGIDEVIYISSADMMTRNTQNRVEIAAPIYDKEIKEQIHHIVDSIWRDNVKARSMANDGTYHIINYNYNSSWNSQEEFMKETKERATKGKETHPSFFSKIIKLFA